MEDFENIDNLLSSNTDEQEMITEQTTEKQKINTYEGEKMESKKGLVIPRYFSKEGTHPADQFTYEKRTSIIKNSDGSSVFEMHDVEVPTSWTQVATDILAQKYFRKAGVPLRDENDELLLDESGKVITGSETSIKQVAHRMAGCWKYWGEKYNYFASFQDAQIFYEEMVYMIINQSAAPNSPQWFSTGLNWAYGLTGPAQGHSYIDPITKQLEFSKDAYSRSQPHACFIQRIDDDLVRKGGILDLLCREARLFKYGSGTGSNFSNLRGKGESLSGGGTSSGLMSFLKIFDVAAGSIKSGGTTRRAAKMISLDLDHPEVQSLIWWKVKEEEKVAHLVAGSKILKKRLEKLMELAKGKETPLADPEVQQALREAAQDEIPLNYLVRTLNLAKQGYTLPFQEFDTHYESEAYLTVSGQNSNNSVRIPNTFFEALQKKGKWNFIARTTGEVMHSIPAEQLWDEIGYCAWASADPGVQFDTTINEWHTCPADGRINGSNPCSEYMFLDDTACNLASINLVKLYNAETGQFDVRGYRHTIRLWTIALELSVLMAHFPDEQIALKSFEYRTMGLGFANIGALLMLQGIPYDSDEGRTFAGALTAIMTGDAYGTSAELASILGPFEHYERNKESMLRVIRNHRQAAYAKENYDNLTITPKALDQNLCPINLLTAAHDAWDNALEKGELYGYRNAQTTVLAPTGTIGLVMDCDTTGVEPDYALVKFKKLAGGGFFKIVNQSVPKALTKLGYNENQVEDIVDYCLGHGTLNGSPFVNSESLRKKGFQEEQLDAIEKELRNSMDIRHVFNRWTLGTEFYNKIMERKDGKEEKEKSFLQALGFNDEQIDEANEYICGAMMLEGAPHLKEEHYAVFDCASKCGNKGQRYIHPYGHLKMLAATQPFLSGAISKTVNMPQDWTVEQIKKAYYDAWEMAIKAVALYRDGSKLSQPLSSTIQENTMLKTILEQKTIEKVSATPLIYFKKVAKIGGRKCVLTAEVRDNSVSSVNVEMDWASPVQQVMMQAIVNGVNMGLQQNLPPREIAEQSLNVKGHPVITELQSFLSEFEEMEISPTIQINEKVKQTEEIQSISKENKSIKCSSCGAKQLRQNGTCMLCEVCGETTGCS